MLVKRAYRSKFKNRPCPTADARNKLKVLFSEDPRLSIVDLIKASVDVEISRSLYRDILLKDLQLKPYKYQSANQILSLDYEKRVIFAQ